MHKYEIAGVLPLSFQLSVSRLSVQCNTGKNIFIRKSKSNRIQRPFQVKGKQWIGPNLYPVGSITACDGDLCGEKERKFLLRHRL